MYNCSAIWLDCLDWTHLQARSCFPTSREWDSTKRRSQTQGGHSRKSETDRKTCSAVRRVLFWLCEVVFLATWSRGLPWGEAANGQTYVNTWMHCAAVFGDLIPMPLMLLAACAQDVLWRTPLESVVAPISLARRQEMKREYWPWAVSRVFWFWWQKKKHVESWN